MVRGKNDRIYLQFLKQICQLQGRSLSDCGLDDSLKAMENRSGKVFISYSSNDREFALKLTDSLIKLGVDIWIDRKSIRAGTNWGNEIWEALKISEIMILIISPSSMASKNVEDEWQYFRDKNKPIIPIQFQPVTDVHFQLNRKNYINFYKLTYETAFEELRRELGSQGVIVY
jgi:hypothetical protein